MNKLEQLLRMTEHPEDYTDAELEEMAGDPEMKAYYELMVQTEAGFKAMRGGSDGRTEPTRNRRLLKLAAALAATLLLSGISYAALTSLQKRHQQVVETTVGAPGRTQEEPTTGKPETGETVRTFEDVELQDIMETLAAHYHVSVVFSNEEARHLRLYTKWDTTAPLSQMLQRLNGFEKVRLRQQGETISIE